MVRCAQAVLAVAVILLTSASVASPGAEARRGGTLRLIVGAEPSSLDPALADGTRLGWALQHATCARLFTTLFDPGTGKLRVVPEVAKSVSVSNHGLTYTLQLRRTFRFHTGAPVTAQSFADALNRDASPSVGSPATRFMYEIVGADAVIQGKTDTISGVRALDRSRLQIRLNRPAGDFLARLTMPFFCPIPPGTPMKPMETSAGSGPYYVAERVPNRQLVLERNPYYRGARPANPDRIVWTIEPDADTRVRAVEQNTSDLTYLFGYPDAVLHDLVSRHGLNRPGGRLLEYPTLTTYFFGFNIHRPAFGSAGQAPLKRAINYAIDRSALTRASGYLSGRPTDRLLPPALSHSRRVYPLGRPDLATARKWLARAGKRPKRLVLYTASFPFGSTTAQVFVSNLRQLGIEVTVKYFGFATLLDKLRTPGEPWDVTWLPWGTSYPEPAGFLVVFFHSAGFHGTKYEARAEAVNRVTGAARDKAWADFEADLMRDDPPVAAYMNPTTVTLLSRSYGCFRRHPVYEVDLAAACKK